MRMEMSFSMLMAIAPVPETEHYGNHELPKTAANRIQKICKKYFFLSPAYSIESLKTALSEKVMRRIMRFLSTG